MVCYIYLELNVQYIRRDMDVMPRDQPNSWGKNARFHGRVFKMC